MKRLPPHPKNVPGDFYVEDGCCVSCDLPKSVAPEHFEYENGHCYVCRQPRTELEILKLIGALEAQDLNCIRYQGTDNKTIEIIRNRGLKSCIQVEKISFISRLRSIFK